MASKELRSWPKGPVGFVWFAPPCATFSRARTTAPVSRPRSRSLPHAPADDAEGLAADLLMDRLAADCFFASSGR